MTDFERGMQKALKEIFYETPLYGCYFHFIKNLWEKQKSRYFQKELNKTTNIIFFSMKIFPYIPESEKEYFLDKMETFINNTNNNNI